MYFGYLSHTANVYSASDLILSQNHCYSWPHFFLHKQEIVSDEGDVMKPDDSKYIVIDSIIHQRAIQAPCRSQL